MKLCPDCLSTYKRSGAGKTARNEGSDWGKGRWPLSLYHSQPTRKCLAHHVQALADSAARRAGIVQATPRWCDRAAVKAIYAECVAVTETTGVRHEVDHVVPLKSARVCGLHIPINLRIITGTENRRKSNYF
ncbi:hypothetical protein LMG2828_01744 [Achromobacter piechaudii]|nr:hypothetical protein LMG2828_01744 [Achromobacter piechaudii]